MSKHVLDLGWGGGNRFSMVQVGANRGWELTFVSLVPFVLIDHAPLPRRTPNIQRLNARRTMLWP